MTSHNPFTDRIAQAAKEGYVNGTRRTYDRPQRQPVRGIHSGDIRATDKQVELIQSLLNERDLSAEIRPKFRARTAVLERDTAEVMALTRDKASALITYLFGLPQESGTTHEPAAFAQVPAGRYAVIIREEVTFLQVDRPTEGRWAGKVFVKLQHGDDTTTMSRVSGFTMLGYIIDQGVKESMLRYGKLIGRCGAPGCGLTLTNALSRELGIGPVCRDKMGW